MAKVVPGPLEREMRQQRAQPQAGCQSGKSKRKSVREVFEFWKLPR